jgi:hypothetical protein
LLVVEVDGGVLKPVVDLFELGELFGWQDVRLILLRARGAFVH